MLGVGPWSACTGIPDTPCGHARHPGSPRLSHQALQGLRGFPVPVNVCPGQRPRLQVTGAASRSRGPKAWRLQEDGENAHATRESGAPAPGPAQGPGHIPAPGPSAEGGRGGDIRRGANPVSIATVKLAGLNQTITCRRQIYFLIKVRETALILGQLLATCKPGEGVVCTMGFRLTGFPPPPPPALMVKL